MKDRGRLDEGSLGALGQTNESIPRAGGRYIFVAHDLRYASRRLTTNNCHLIANSRRLSINRWQQPANHKPRAPKEAGNFRTATPDFTSVLETTSKKGQIAPQSLQSLRPNGSYAAAHETCWTIVVLHTGTGMFEQQ